MYKRCNVIIKLRKNFAIIISPFFHVQLISHVLATNFIILLLSGRFDFHIKLPAPAASERKAMLKHIIQRRHLQCNDDILLDVAAKCDGYDGYDLVF